MDCQLFGLNPGGHHLTNLLFHIANTLLLFLLLKKLTGAIWRSAFVAALFAWHPLHVESVAWASERKDVLSAFFWMLTLLAYARYVQSMSKVQSPKLHKSFYYVLALVFVCVRADVQADGRDAAVCFAAAGFLAAATIQFDFNDSTSACSKKFRSSRCRWPRASITYRVAKRRALVVNGRCHLISALANALMSYARYISKIFWPADLALIYPYPHYWPLAGVIGVGRVARPAVGHFYFQAKRFPYLPVGWFWFLGTLVPAIGLVQVGVQSMADRYTYLPCIGIFILAVWGVNDLLNSRPQKIKIAALAGAAILTGCLICTSIQLNYWRNSVALFRAHGSSHHGQLRRRRLPRQIAGKHRQK